MSPADSSARHALEALVRGNRTPGLQYLVVDKDHTVFEYVGGWADLRAQRAMTTGTTMMAYSMSKTITAAAVLQLVEAQHIDLDGSLDRYLDSQPYGHDVTVRHLLSHTSGIPNPMPLRWVHPISGYAAFREDVALSEVRPDRRVRQVVATDSWPLSQRAGVWRAGGHHQRIWRVSPGSAAAAIVSLR